jgi:hypothetical protein
VFEEAWRKVLAMKTTGSVVACYTNLATTVSRQVEIVVVDNCRLINL